MGQSVIMLIVFGIFMLAFGIYYLMSKSKSTKGEKNSVVTNKTEHSETVGVKRQEKEIPSRDMSEFMNFDKIANDMIYQKNGERYTMVIECKGINYELMSEVEQMAVEEGFITFLNTLKYPIQLYVQTRSIDLGENIKKYKERVKEFSSVQADAAEKYNKLEDDIDASDEEIEEARKEKVKYTNIAEYVSDVTKYVERMALNKYMLQRKFYVIISYNKSEIASTEKFTKEEYEDLCYRELYTRAQGVIGSLISCSVQGRILSSNELAQLIYISLNKDDERAMDIKKALDAGFYRLYTTSEDVFEKKNAMLDEQIEQMSIERAQEAMREGIANGTIIPEDVMKNVVDKEVDRRAIKLVDRTNEKPEVKAEVKRIITENRKKRLREQDEKKKAEEKMNKEIEETSKLEEENESVEQEKTSEVDVKKESTKDTTSDDVSIV